MSTAMHSNGIFLLLCVPAVVFGHGFLQEPKPRNLVHETYRFTYPGGDGSGNRDNNAVKNRIIAGNFSFPDLYPSEGTHGLCGDPWRSAGIDDMPAIADQEMMRPGPYQAVYTEGEVISVEVAITANHRGYVEFRICDHVLDTTLGSQAEGQLCLDQHTLQRLDPFDPLRGGECGTPANPVSPKDNIECAPLDPLYPSRTYVPADALLADNEGGSGRVFSVKLKLPEGLTCHETCTMQWWWMTSNACIPEGEVAWYDALHTQYPETVGVWDPTGRWAGRTCTVEKQGQQFWNCADIVILAQGATAPPQMTPDPADNNGESDDNNGGGGGDNCKNTWGDCTGGQCCQAAGDVCYVQSGAYHQCMPEGECAFRFSNDPNWACTISWPPPPESTPVYDVENEGWPDVTDPDSTTAEEGPGTTAAANPPTPPATSKEAAPPTTPSPAPKTTREATTPPTTPPTPVITPPPYHGSVDGCFEGGQIGEYGNCTGQHSGCCGNGLLCYAFNDDYAQCRRPGTCPDCQWTCAVVARPCTNLIGKHGNCRASHCCAEGLVCYEQDDGYAQCLPAGECPVCDSWTCNVLHHGLTDAPAPARRSSESYETGPRDNTDDGYNMKQTESSPPRTARRSGLPAEFATESFQVAAPTGNDSEPGRLKTLRGAGLAALAGSVLVLSAGWYTVTRRGRREASAKAVVEEDGTC